MKKISILLNVVLISFIVLEACDPKLYPKSSNLFCPGCPQYDYSGGVSTGTGKGHVAGLDLQTVQLMADGYKKNCLPQLNPNPKSGEDARCVWFSVETLKEFIFNIEKARCLNDCSKNLELGVRIYYAQYPTYSSLSGKPQADLSLLNSTDGSSYQLNHTVFMVPTFNKGNDHIDFDPWHMIDKNHNCTNPATMDDLIKGKFAGQNVLVLSPDQQQFGRISEKISTTTSKLDGNSLLQNHGNLYPPDNATGVAF